MIIKQKIKPKIAIIIDKNGWAFSNAANQIKQNLSKYYVIDIISMEDFGDNIAKLFIFCYEYDIVYFMWRGLISWIYSDYSKYCIKELGFDYEDFLEKYIKNKCILTGVYDHFFLDEEKERTDFILGVVKDYIVCSEKLNKIYNKFNKKPSFVISDGVDLDLFYMKNPKKYKDTNNRKIRIGWTGNSKFQDDTDDDLKGLNRIIKPAVLELIEEGYEVELNIADRNINMIPHNEMIDYYNNIDIYICSSRTEGHPDPILEAMACGIPIISTNVGIVSEIFGKRQKNFIINRNKDELKCKLIELINNNNILKDLSKENVRRIKKWSWKRKAKLYKKFFDKNLK